MATYTASHHPRYGTREQIAHAYAQAQLADAAALADPRPSTVTLAHFMKRNMNADIAAGRCTFSCSHPIFSSAPRLSVIEIRQQASNYFVIVDATGREWVYRSARSTVDVTWHDLPDTWAQLSPAMRNALRYLAGDGGRKPRPNTLRALTKRRLVRKGKIVRSALALYRNHQAEFAHV